MRKSPNQGKMVMALVGAALFWMLATPLGEARADYSEAKRWFETKSPTDRVSLQDALYWSGDYFGPIDARFGPQTYASLVAFQRRSRARPTGVLNARERAALNREAERIRHLVYYHSRRVGTAPDRVYRSRGSALALPILILP